MFKLFVQVTDSDGEKIVVDNLFEFVKEKIKYKPDENFIRISGPDGTGKSTFLSILYMYLYECYIKQEISIYPFYINLHYYDKAVVGRESEFKKVEQISRMIANDMEQLIEVSQDSDNGVLLIIDGNESYFRTTLPTSSALIKVLEEFEECKKIICIGEKTNVHTYKKRKSAMPLDGSTKYNFSFKTIYVENKLSYNNFIDKFLEIQNMWVYKHEIINNINKFKLREVDYNLLSVFKGCYQNGNLNDVNSLSELYRKYCLIYFDNDEEKIDYCSELAYKRFMTPENIRQETISNHWKEWELIHQHKTISNYFLATYYGKLIVNYDKGNIKKLECIFSSGINLFLKSMINESIDCQKKVIDNCKKLYEQGSYLAKSQSAYILGRIEDRSLHAGIKKYLEVEYEKLFNELNKNRRIEKYKIFLFRTISISLFTLGDNDNKGKNLLEKLLTDYSLNEVNRAFFLQYYDDIEHELERIDFEDTGSETMTFTFDVLLNQINFQLKKNKQYWQPKEQYGFQLNLFTLCSLVQVRLDKQIENSYVDEIKNVIDRALNCTKLRLYKKLEVYLLMLKDDIEKNKYNARHIYNELYAAKDVIRSGWKDKIQTGSIAVDRYENIVEHMYYTWLLGMLYLPDEIQSDEPAYKYYNKNKILDCILIHDLSQTYVGDKRPEETTDKYKNKKNERMQEIFMHDTYTDVQSMNRYRNVWKRYEMDLHDINGKVARDLEIIQSVYQFYVYKKNGAMFEEGKEKEWKEEYRKIETTIGQKIYDEVVGKTFSDLVE